MTDLQQKQAAKEFIKNWTGRGDEKQDTQSFWLAFLRDVFGVDKPEELIRFEVPVKLGHTSFIDAYIDSTHILIEQKGKDIDLRKGYKQSDGALMTPFQQARRYAGNLPHNMNPRWIIVCNFQEFHIHDMNRPNDPAEVIKLSDLEREIHRFKFILDTGSELLRREMEISLQAGELVGKLYDALLKQYNSPASDEELKSLNMLCVRLVFCLYAEDAGIFGGHTMFHDYLKGFNPKNVRKALIDLFKVLDTKVTDRDPYMDEELAAFPYVNGGLFADENIIIPRFNEEIVELLLTKASEDFDWSSISPTIFGAVFESTLNPETRRSGGMHYTSIENIHKVTDPLFFEALSDELEEISAVAVKKTRDRKLEDFQKKLASLKFLDPACGSGNFLTETYLSLRRLENRAVSLRLGDQIVLGDAEDFNPIRVSIGQFYGIEINDFAVTVARTALWIAESQMMKETEEIVHMNLDFLPLTSYANIVEANALRIDWETVVPKNELNYIMGNPPFVGYTQQTKEQKEDIQRIAPGIEKTVDYVAMWYFKAAKFMEGKVVRSAFVSTNSITQGEQVEIIWKPMFDKLGVHIDFAHQSFIWDSETSQKAHVHCVIVGFSVAPNSAQRHLYSSGRVKKVGHISPYLLEAPTVFISKRSKPLCSVPKVSKGSQPTDGGNLIVTAEQYALFAEKEPAALQHIKPFLGAEEFINGKKRYCLWLAGVSPKAIANLPMVRDRVSRVREFRLASKKEATRKWADKPTLFTENRQPTCEFITIPEVSSGNRKYIPMGFLDSETICSNKLQTIQGAELYHFGVLTSNVHMAWTKKICGRLKSDYDYSAKIVYNNFPWPNPTESQKAKIEQTAQAILDARALYPESSLADLYDEVTMPPELRRAHQQNDKAVMQAYGFWGKLNTESECVAELMKMYQELTK
ncbi:MAG: methylase [Oscillospiraceae bacterium]|nr:methylase [Oscillospiraceae bacterium]